MLSFTKRDIAAGDFKYGERIQLVRVLSKEDSTDLDKLVGIMQVLHDITPSVKEAATLTDYAKYVLEELNKWLMREQQECYVAPTSEQTQAGIDKLTAEIGDMGGVVAIAEARGWTFEQVYNLPYTEVFTIWKVGAARERYERRYNEILKRNAKKK